MTFQRIFDSDSDDLKVLMAAAGGQPEYFYVGANMHGVDISGQDLSGINFMGSTGWHDVKSDDRTILPDGFFRVSSREPDIIVNPAEMAEEMRAAVLAAGAVIMKGFQSGALEETKADGSPVTKYDKLASDIIAEKLGSKFPKIQVIDEEYVVSTHKAFGNAFFLIDPLDGTREFIDKTGHFTVNIALIVGGRPMIGAIYVPSERTLYEGRGGSATKSYCIDGVWGNGRRIRVRSFHTDARALVVSRRRGYTPEIEQYHQRFPDAVIDRTGSSYKFCLLAEGKYDAYPCFVATRAWDTAAGQAIVEAAGGRVIDITTGRDLDYGARLKRGDFTNPSFIAANHNLQVLDDFGINHPRD